ncbi:maleylpyruvate isomerase family mycothiol-dependent enzyme [Crossiella sp. S99.2]|nr:maleylpyruvate isomerase family mycothiol-dependent enzyme [Crossiella sp. S99.2]MCK2258260.1 maleylpyruvate isomerase family mycothiol-dependent enzyme [Crossiella sp. S99.1]
MARAERADFLDFLRTLPAEQWEAPTLCGDWRVREVVAHVISYDELTLGGVAAQFARGRFSLDRSNALRLTDYRALSPAELLDAFERHVQPRGLTASFGGMVALLDGLIHHQDIRRALGLPREIPADRLLRALRLSRLAPPIGAWWRSRGLRLVAEDVHWSVGSGAEVRGKGEALLMATAGRLVPAAELTGPGAPVLLARRG